MPKVSPIQTSFSSGELSPLCYGRVDSERYKAALKKCLNFIPTIQGGLTRRGGTVFVSEAKFKNKKVRLMPFEFSITQAYMLEVGDLYIRFYKDRGLITEATKNISNITQANPAVVTSNSHGYSNGDRVILSGIFGMVELNNREFQVAGVTTNTFQLQSTIGVNINSISYGSYVSGGTIAKVYEIVTPYPEADIFNLRITQSADILYITNPSYQPRKLSRTGHTNWTLDKMNILDGPYLVTNSNNKLNVTNNAQSGDVTLTFGPTLTVGGAINNGSGLIRVSVTTPHFKNDGDKVYIQNVTGTTEANGTWTVTVVDTVTVDLRGSVFVNAYISGGSMNPAIFTSGDIGRLIRIKVSTSWGYAQITSITNPAVVHAAGKKEFDSTGTTTNFRLGIWSDILGWPAVTVFHEDRLFFAGGTSTPQRLDGSNSGDYENFAPTDTDGTVKSSNAVSFSFNSNDVNLVRWITSDEKGLLAGTIGGEWVTKASSQTEALSPTNIQAKRATFFGSQNVQPVQSGKATLFLQRGGKKLREMNYYFDVDGFRSQDLTQLSEHITAEGITQLTYQKLPLSIVWGVRQDGVLVGMTYERDPDSLKVGWHRHEIGGSGDSSGSIAAAESVSVIPSIDTTYEDLWIVMKRYVNGETKRYIEYVSKIFEDTDEQQDAFFVDSGLTYDIPLTITAATQANPVQITVASHGLSNGNKVLIQDVSGMTELNTNTYIVSGATTNTFTLTNKNGGTGNVNGSAFNAYISGGAVRKMVTSISGLFHIEGEVASILADGAVRPSVTVINGSITLTDPAAIVHIGKGYNSDMQMLRIDAGSADGTSLGKTRRTQRVGILLHRTLGIKIGMSSDSLNTITFRRTSDRLTRAPGLFSGVITETMDADYDTENEIYIRQGQPLPCTILSVMPIMTTNDRS